MIVAGHLLPKSGAPLAEQTAETVPHEASVEAVGGDVGARAASVQAPQGATSKAATVQNGAKKVERASESRHPMVVAPPKGASSMVGELRMAGSEKDTSLRETDAETGVGDGKTANWSTKTQRKEGPGASGGQLKRTNADAEREKELNRLQLENDLLREALRQKESIHSLESEVQALRESLSGRLVCSGPKTDARPYTVASIDSLCFKCQRAVLRRPR